MLHGGDSPGGEGAAIREYDVGIVGGVGAWRGGRVRGGVGGLEVGGSFIDFTEDHDELDIW